jgi:large subunit ribosomal protein L13
MNTQRGVYLFLLAALSRLAGAYRQKSEFVPPVAKSAATSQAKPRLAAVQGRVTEEPPQLKDPELGMNKGAYQAAKHIRNVFQDLKPEDQTLNAPLENGLTLRNRVRVFNKQHSWVPSELDLKAQAKKWWIIDADGMRLGRMAVEIAKLIMGKHKYTFTPGAQMGDYVIVINAEKVMVTGNKYEDKLYRRHSGRPGGMKIETFRQLQARIPERIIEKAIWGMIPKNSYGRQCLTRVKVYKGPDHPHEAQNPEVYDVAKYSRLAPVEDPQQTWKPKQQTQVLDSIYRKK